MTRSAVEPIDAPEGPVRVAFQQPSLAAYRVPFFRELAGRPGVDVGLWYGDRAGIDNVAADGFSATAVPLVRRKVGPLPVYWHRAQFDAVSPGVADVAVLVWNPQYVSLVPAMRRARRRGVATLLWGHGYSKRESAWRRRMRYAVARRADGVVFYDDATAARAVDAGWLPADRVFVAPNAIDGRPVDDAIGRVAGVARPDADPAGFRRRGDVSDALAGFRRRQGIDPERTLLFVSRLHRDNRLDLAVRALATLPPPWSDTRLAVVGAGDEEAERLRALAADTGVAGRIIWAGPVYDDDELARWFLSARAFVYPSNVGLSVFHAMHHGVPPVTSSRADRQNPEFHSLRPGENVVTFETPDGDVGDDRAVANLGAALTRLLADDDFHRSVSDAALRHVRTRQSLAAMADGFEHAVRVVAGRMNR